MDSISRYIVSRVGRLATDSMMERVPVWSIGDDCIIVAKNGTLSTMIELSGINREFGHEELVNHATGLRVLLSPLLSDGYHSIELSFRRCSYEMAQIIEAGIADDHVMAGKYDLDLLDVIDGRRETRGDAMISEAALLTVFTPMKSTGQLTQPADSSTGQQGTRSGEDGQVMIHARHRTTVNALYRDLERIGYSCRMMESREYVSEMASAIYPMFPRQDRSGESWLPSAVMDNEYSLDRYLASEPVRLLDSGTVATPASIVSGFDVTLAPERLLPFNDLVGSITAALPSVSWRCSFKYHARGLQKHRLREQFVRLFTFTNRVRHERMRDAFDRLRDVDGSSDTVVQLQMCFTTWSGISTMEQHMEHAWMLRKTVEQWGNCITDCLTGDPLSTILASVPGLSPGSTAPVSAAPLTCALEIAPIARQCSPWSSGENLLRTADGRPWPYQRGSPVQNSWVEIFIGNSGSGKSVAMNSFNLESILDIRNNSTGNDRIPRIAVIDVGGSSKALVDVVREGLPPERHDDAVHVQFRALPEYAINIFDTPLGCRFPTPSGRAFLVNFLSILLDRKDISEFEGMIGGVIDLAYEQVSDMRDPKRYSMGEIVDVDRELAGSGYVPADGSSWWNVVDWLFRMGKPHLASRAQTRAVPVMPDLMTASLNHQIRITYGSEGDDEDTLHPARLLRRAISEVVRDMPNLAMDTKFRISGARLVVVDLEEVTTGGNDAQSKRQTALMFMLARNAVMREWDVGKEDIEALSAAGKMPDIYRDLHMLKAETNRVDPKQICVDEYHRVSAVEGVRRQVLQDMREGRKRNLRISLASQYAEDFTGGLLESASSVLLFNSPSPDAMTWFSKLFALNDHDRQLARTWLTGPGPRGAPLLGMFNTRRGQVVQKLLLTLSPIELWALTSTAEDVHLLNMMYRRVDSRKARQMLAKRYPAGSAKRDIDRQLANQGSMAGQEVTSMTENIFARLVNEMLTDNYLQE